MEKGEFRVAYFSDCYEETLEFYRDTLNFTVHRQWDRGDEDRGCIFSSGKGLIEVILRPTEAKESSPYDFRPPQGTMFVIEVEDVEKLAATLSAKKVKLAEELREQSWRHKSLSVHEPNGLLLYLFTPTEAA